MSVSAISTLNASYWQQIFGDSSSKKSRKNEGEDLASMLMQDLDADGSGGLSLEKSGLTQEKHKVVDEDGDGNISAEELQAALAKQREEQYAALQQRAMNARIQMAGDDSAPAQGEQSGETRRITGQELLASIMRGDRLDGPPPGPLGGPPPPPPENDDLPAKLFAGLDVDESGGVDLSVSGLSKSEFDSMDSNQDGMVSAEELSAALEKQLAAFGRNAVSSTGGSAAASGSSGGAAALFGTAGESLPSSILTNMAGNAYAAGMRLHSGAEPALSMTA